MLTIANLITMLRIIGAVCLLFTEPLSKTFFVIYTISGISDALDGFIARKTNTVTEFGSTLDSIADIVFYTVMVLRLLPILLLKLPFWIWYTVAVFLILRCTSYIVAAVKYGKFSSMHTHLNKASTLMTFFVPYLINNGILSAFCVTICIFGIVSSAEELVIHIRQKIYRP